MWSSVTVLLLDGIIEYAFGGVSEPNTVCIANAFLKLFLMATCLVLSSTRGVARRARLLLSGSVQAFKYLLEESSPSDRGAHYLMSETRRQKRTELRYESLS